MMTNKYLLALSFAVIVSPATFAAGQSPSTGKDKMKAYKEYQEKAQQSYNKHQEDAINRYIAYRDSVLGEYVKFMGKPWTKTKVDPSKPKPVDNSIEPEITVLKVKPTPPKEEKKPIKEEVKEPVKEETPPIKEEKKPIKEEVKEPVKEETTPVIEEKAPVEEVIDRGQLSSVKIDIKGVLEIPSIEDIHPPVPFVPVITPDEEPQSAKFDYTFFGTPVSVTIDESCRFSISTVNNTGIAAAMEAITKNEQFNVTLADCLTLRKEHRLCDWAYFKLLTGLGDKFYGKDTNESTLFAGYMFCMSGYKMRFGYNDSGKLFVLAACDQYISDIPYVSLDSDNFRRYFVIGAKEFARIYICDFALPNEKSMSLYITDQPILAEDNANRVMQLYSYRSIKLDYNVNKNLIDFYNTYPTPNTEGDAYSRWTYYAQAPISEQAKETVYPQLREAIKGKTELQAVNIFLNFIETYEYGYDDQVWGYDRAFFPDETLFYPSSDCEDHAILLSRLVRDLLGLDIALVYYPGHLATAIRFNEEVRGDYIEHEGMKYTVCDPTIQYASAGRTMRGVSNSEAYMIFLR